jgi:hypothetical protein
MRVVRGERARAALTGIVCLAATWPRSAAAAASDAAPSADAVEGNIVQVEENDLVLDLGTLRGASPGDVVEVWRPMRIKHPVTGRFLVDRILIGRLKLGQVRPNLSLATPNGSLTRPAEPGDVVVLPRPLSPPPAPPQAPTPSPAPSATPTPGPTPNSTPTPTQAPTTAPTPAPASATTTVPVARAQEIERVFAGEPLRVAIFLTPPASGAVLHARTAGDETYVSQPMAKVGTEYWAATIPPERVRSPSVEWFVEAVSPDGTVPVVGEASAPRTAAVEDVSPQAPSRKVLGQAAIWTDYASFNVHSNDDYVWQTEGVMGARFDDVGIRAVRTGFGVYRGLGGTLQQLDVQHQPGTPVGLTYGYLETEFGIVPTFSIAARAIVGLQQDGVGGGASAFFRIGSDLETNLLVGGEVLGGIGLRGVAEFDWNTFRNWPIVLRSEVTNQPAGLEGDVGVRLIGQVGYRVLPHMVVSARGSYQGRTIDHAGPGAGAALGYAW